jgi:hypothetical protein
VVTRRVPILLAAPIALALGVGLAWVGRVDLARAELPVFLTRPFAVACALGGLVLAPVLGYFLAFHEDWSYLYLVRGADMPSAIDLALVVAVCALVPGALALASPLAVARRGPLLARIVGVLVLLTALAALVAVRRLSVSATYSQYHGGYGITPIGRSALGRGVLLGWATLIAGFAWSARVLSRRSS